MCAIGDLEAFPRSVLILGERTASSKFPVGLGGIVGADEARLNRSHICSHICFLLLGNTYVYKIIFTLYVSSIHAHLLNTFSGIPFLTIIFLRYVRSDFRIYSDKKKPDNDLDNCNYFKSLYLKVIEFFSRS